MVLDVGYAKSDAYSRDGAPSEECRNNTYLQRRAGQEQALVEREAVKRLCELGVAVLHALRLVDDQVLPRHLRASSSR